MHRPISALISFILLSGMATSAFAQQSPALDKFNLSIGGFQGYTNTDLSAHPNDLSENPTGKVNLEDDLGLHHRENIGRIKAEALLGDHQGIDVDFYQFHRSHSGSFSDSLSYNDDNADLSATVHGKMDLELGSVTYRYWFGQDNNVFGVGLGAAWYHVNFRLTGEGQSVSPNPDLNETGFASTSYSDGAWAPVLSLGYRHAFSDQLRWYADLSGVKKNGGNLSGHIYSGALGVEYYPWKNVGFGVEYSVSKIQLSRNRPNYDAQLDLKTYGPGAYLKVRF